MKSSQRDADFIRKRHRSCIKWNFHGSKSRTAESIFFQTMKRFVFCLAPTSFAAVVPTLFYLFESEKKGEAKCIENTLIFLSAFNYCATLK